jgi:SAM-dependent methyltransferase
MERLLEATAQAERHHFWFRGFRRFVAPLIALAVEGRPAPRVLDCGFGTGTNFAMLEERARAFGVELEPAGVSLARRAGHTRIARATVTALPVPDASFDLATSFDVLYCLPEPAESDAIAEMFRVLRPGGHAIVNVVALGVLRGNHSILSGELRRYTRRALRERLERGGFEIRRLTYTNAVLLPVMLPVRIGQQLAGLHMPEGPITETTVPPWPVNVALTAALAAEAALVRWVDMPVGSSLLCLARKPERRPGAARPSD